MKLVLEKRPRDGEEVCLELHSREGRQALPLRGRMKVAFLKHSAPMAGEVKRVAFTREPESLAARGLAGIASKV